MPAGGRTRSALATRAFVVALVVASGVTMTGLSAQSADAPITVTGVDSLGFPYVDLIVTGIAGSTSDAPPAIAVTQSGERVPTTSTWLLSDDQPLAVVTDATSADLPQVQGIVGELVQAMPPDLPLSLVSTRTGRASSPTLNRDAFMTQLQRQRGSTAEPISTAVTSAAAAGIQHVFVVTTCASPVPGRLPIGVITDVIGVGPSCTAEWRSALAGRAGRFSAARDTTGALSALDAMVSAWRTSVVLIAQVSTRQALQVAFGTQHATVVIGGAGTPAPTPSARDQSSGGSGGLVLVLGLLLLMLAVILGAVWVARRRRRPPDHSERDEDLADDLQRMVRADTLAQTRPPAVIDLRDHPAPVEPSPVEASPVEPSPVEASPIGAGLATHEADVMPLMAVATPAPVGQAERPRPATVARQHAPEEPVAMAEEPVVNDVTDEADREPAAMEASTEATAEATEASPEMVDDEAAAALQTDAPTDAPTETPTDAPTDTPTDTPVEAQAEEQAEEQPVVTGGLPPIQFNWTPLQFSPLAWRYDAEPEQSEIDLREPAAIDVREKAGRRQPRRKKANR
jgi:hypothetical protein